MRSITPWWRKTPWRIVREWRAEVKKRNAEHNLSVQTRQVARRKLFEEEMISVYQQIGGEPRHARRGIARVRSKRYWLYLKTRRAA